MWNSEAVRLMDWAAEENNRIRAQKMTRAAEKMENLYRAVLGVSPVKDIHDAYRSYGWHLPKTFSPLYLSGKFSRLFLPGKYIENWSDTMTKTTLATASEEKVYCPASIDEVYRRFPGIGRIVRIKYQREYVGGTEEADGKKRPVVTRIGVVIQKAKHKHGAHFTVEFKPEIREGKRGGYRATFNFVDIITGKIKVVEVVGG